MVVERRLLQGLIRYANRAEASLLTLWKPGIVRNAKGKVLLSVTSTPECLSPIEEQILRARTCEFLHMAMINLDVLAGVLSSQLSASLVALPLKPARGIFTKPRAAPSALALRIDATATWNWIYAVMALALITPIGDNDCLANRIQQCEHCGDYFLLPTSRPSRACGVRCRNALKKKN